MSTGLETARTLCRQIGLFLAGTAFGMTSKKLKFPAENAVINFFTSFAQCYFVIYDLSVFSIAMSALNKADYRILAVARVVSYTAEAIVRLICFEMLLKRVQMQISIESNDKTLVKIYRYIAVFICAVQFFVSIASFIWVSVAEIKSAQTVLTDIGLRIMRCTYYSFAVGLSLFYDISLFRKIDVHVKNIISLTTTNQGELREIESSTNDNTSSIRRMSSLPQPQKSIISPPAPNFQKQVKVSSSQKFKLLLFADVLLALGIFTTVILSFIIGYIGFDTYIICIECSLSFYLLKAIKSEIQTLFHKKETSSNLPKSSVFVENRSCPAADPK